MQYVCCVSSVCVCVGGGGGGGVYQISEKMISRGGGSKAKIEFIYVHYNDFFMRFCPGTMTTHAELINSDLQRGLGTRLRHTHTTLNTEQNHLAIKVSADN